MSISFLILYNAYVYDMLRHDTMSCKRHGMISGVYTCV